MRKRLPDLIRSLRPARCVLALIVSIGIAFPSSSIADGYAVDTTEKPEPEMALPGEPCKISPRSAWTAPERWAWRQICEGEDADFNKSLGSELDLTECSYDYESEDDYESSYDCYYEWPDSGRKLSTDFLKTILLYEPFRTAIPHRGVRLVGAYFEDDINLSDSPIERPLLIQGSLFKWQVLMRRLTTPWFISFDASRFDNTLDMASISIEDDLFMRGAKFRKVILLGAEVSGQLAMTGSTLFGTLDMDSAVIGDHLFMNGKAKFENVVLGEAKIGGLLEMSASKFDGQLNMNSVSIAGALRMRGSEFNKPVIVKRGDIGADVFLSSSNFKDSINMQGTSIGGDLNTGEVTNVTTRFDDFVILLETRVGGDLDLVSSNFNNQVLLDSTSIGESVFIQSAFFDQPVSFANVIVGSSLAMNNVSFTSLDFTGAEIKDVLDLDMFGNTRWKNYKDKDGNVHQPKLTLRNASVGLLRHTKYAWPDSMELHGFTYKRIGGNGEKGPYDEGSDWFIKWLAKDKPYSRQPYLHLAGVLRAAGHDDMADEILYANRERERVDPKTWWGRKVLLSALNITIGYGYGFKYFRALGWVLGLAFLGMVLLWFKRRNDKLILHNKRQELAKVELEKRGPVFRQVLEKEESWKRLAALGFWFSLDMLLPVIRLREKHYEVELDGWIQYYFFVQQMLGYLLMFFVISGLTGITEWGQTSQGNNLLAP